MEFVFFDLDGTLLDNTAAFPQVFVDVLARNGVVTDLPDLEDALRACWPWYEDNVGRHTDDEMSFWIRFNTRVAQTAGAGDRAGDIGRAITEAFGQLDTPRLYPDVLPCLDALAARGLHLGVITARPDAQRVLAPLDVLDRFEVVIDAFTAHSAKQDPTAFELALELARVPADRAVHVGDQIDRDVVPATQAGLTAILLDREERHPDAVVPRLEDLRGLADLLGEAP